MECLTLRLRQCLIIVLTLASSMASADSLRQVFLVQNSGWMEPFYSDPASSFKPLITQLVSAAAGSSQVVIGGFNQADNQHPSPEWIYRGPANHASLPTYINSLKLERKASGA